jgi:peptidoglycan/LPS O-acetylase OafA/YrhL
VLRAIAVVSVVGHHVEHYSLWTKAGWIGVDLFFVLSGFLISGLLFQEYKTNGEIKILRFLLRRGLKIWPSYYLLLVVAMLICLLSQPTAFKTLKTQLISNVLVIQNYLPGSSYVILVHTWTLAVEEHFYLILPILLAFLIHSGKKGNPFRAIPLLSLAVAVVCLFFRVFTLKPFHMAWATHMRIDGLFGGVALSYLRHFKPEWFNRLTGNYALVLTAILISPAFLFEQSDRRMQTYGVTSLAVGFIFLVAWAVGRAPKSRVVRTILGATARIGLYSYSIYLWHTVFILALVGFQPVSFVRFWLYLACCIAGGIAMAHLVEIPYLRLRDRLIPPITPSIGDNIRLSWTSTRCSANQSPNEPH